MTGGQTAYLFAERVNVYLVVYARVITGVNKERSCDSDESVNIAPVARERCLMDIKQLKTFISLARTLNYQKTGEQLNYAPSTLYSQIQSLERELDTILFQKTGRKLSLTQDGSAFLPYAQRLIADYEDAVAAVAPRGAAEESLSVGGCEVNTGYTIVKTLSGFTKRYPSVHMNMMSVSNASVPNLVKAGVIELGLYFTLKEQGIPDCQTALLRRQPVVLFAAEDHPLAGKEHLHYGDLAGCDFAFPHDDCLFVVEMLRRIRTDISHYSGGRGRICHRDREERRAWRRYGRLWRCL